VSQRTHEHEASSGPSSGATESVNLIFGVQNILQDIVDLNLRICAWPLANHQATPQSGTVSSTIPKYFVISTAMTTHFIAEIVG